MGLYLFLIVMRNMNFKPITKQVWHKKTMALYKTKEKEKLIKIWGKREAKKYFPDLDKRIIFYSPYFEKFSVLKRQFSKCENLELKEIGI